MSHRTTRFVISVLAPDRVGIIANVSDALFRLDANLEALSQTVVGAWFTMIMCAAFPAGMTANRIKSTLKSAVGVQALVAPFDETKHAGRVHGEPFVVTAVGGDKPGIVRRLAGCFAKRGVNIDDVWNEVRDDQFTIIFHVTVPPDVDPKEIRYELEQQAAELGVSVWMQHRDIFTATNSIAVHTKRPQIGGGTSGRNR